MGCACSKKKNNDYSNELINLNIYRNRFRRPKEVNDVEYQLFDSNRIFCNNEETVFILREAAKANDFKLVHIMIEHGVDYNSCDSSGMSPFLYFCMNGNCDAVKYFLKLPKIDFNSFVKNPLIVASNYSHHHIVKVLLAMPGINVNARDRKNSTALIRASKNNFNNIKALLSFPEIEFNARDSNRETALIKASKSGNKEIVEILVSIPGIKVNAKRHKRSNVTIKCETALIIASERGHLEVVQILLNVPGININISYLETRTALMQAAAGEHTEIVKLLVAAKGIDINHIDLYGHNALDIARLYLNPDHQIIKILLDAGSAERQQLFIKYNIIL